MLFAGFGYVPDILCDILSFSRNTGSVNSTTLYVDGDKLDLPSYFI